MDEINESQPVIYAKGTNKKAILILHSFGIRIEETDLLFDYFRKKNLTVYRPIMPGHSGSLEDLKKYGPKDWLREAKSALERISAEAEEIVLIGVSFGSNIAVSLCTEGSEKIKGLVITEMPLFFSPKISLVLNLIQPIYQLLGIDFISKNSRLYRKNRLEREGSFNYVPVRVAGEIRRYVKRVTRRELAGLNIPVLALYAERSDMVNSKKILKYIQQRLDPDKRDFYVVPVSNHDLNVLDEPGRVLMLDKIHSFVEKL